MALQGRLDCAGGSDRILGAGDRATDYEHAGTVVASSTRGDDALLVTARMFGQANSRNDEEAALPLLVDRSDLAS